MSGYSYVRKPQTKRPTVFEQNLTGVFIGLLLFLTSLFLLLGVLQFWFMGRVLPGISVSGLSLEGLTVDQAAQKIEQSMTFQQSGRFLLYDPMTQKSWKWTPAQLGITLDSQATARLALSVGRSNNPLINLQQQISTWVFKHDISPVMVFDERLAYARLLQIDEQVSQPVVNAGLVLNGLQVQQISPQTVRLVDLRATLDLIHSRSRIFVDAALPLAIVEEQPLVTDSSAQVAQVRDILSQPVSLAMPEGQADQNAAGSWTLNPAALAAMLRLNYITTDGKTSLELSVDHPTMLSFMTPLAPKIQQKKQNARFIFNDDTHQLELINHAVVGRSLDIEKSSTFVEQSILAGEHQITLPLEIDPPPIGDDKTAADLGITELIYKETSYYYGSPDERVQNIIAAAKSFHGYLLAPGETLSMADIMGDVSLDTGYAEALIISGGKTIKGVGGGVCQVSTTLFRAAFFSGFPIVERHPHAYRVGYYEYDQKGNSDPKYAGLDATVFVPQVDFKFKNDSSSWLLMETYINPSFSSLVWKFYGADDGRIVEWETSGPTDVVEHPKDLYRENPDLPEGEVKKIDYAADGADITVRRIVRKDGAVLDDDTFKTHYEPWQAVYEYGPGTEGMPPEDSATP